MLGAVRNRDEAVQWLGYPYLCVYLRFLFFLNLTLVCSYIGMLKSPALYSVGVDYQEEDGALVQNRADVAHSAAVLLLKCQLVKYERLSGRFQSTELGQIASYYYVTYNSMMVYNQHSHSTMSTLELLRVFALSNEFKFVPVCFLQIAYVP